MHKPLIATSLAIVLLSAAFATQVQAAGAKKAAAPDPAAVAAGQAVFTKNCFPCHSTNEGQKKVGPSLFHELQEHKHTETEIRGFLLNGRKGEIGIMPSFKDKLTKEDTDALLAYLKTV
ncbi:MAG TPA: cytochrome c [Granulicella sp.]